ncbi:MAG TPA: N-6 DNA methylase [Spirochaetia bacterium]|nr:MAG: N-6 DNA methylase [Spirochaetes bacterium GWB1_36_13]HCL55497.1 N-6 DNA methylase [Spirochaetia bacterium]
MAQNIMQYESKIWATADLLRGVGFKESTFPEFMMPFFALMMVESRLIREADKVRGDFDLPNQLQDFLSEVQDMGQGYNEYILKNNKSLIDIVKNDKTFDTDLELYLKSFDPETQTLLGVNKGEHEEKYLDISGKSGQLRKKGILFAFVKAWAEIDLKPFDNSEITTLEEHIKRKWADISAETAGEQYTPNDIISLIGEICAHKLPKQDTFVTVYDPACGGGNMLFGVEDKIKEKLHRPTATFGQDWNDALYALAKIESRFREDSDIAYGNTLTTIPHIAKKFDVIVANPPYGVDWKGYEKDIKNDKTERFVALPSISDGQLLFTQHIIYQLDTNGIAVVVHNGSSLFSGDAGSGESQIRKYFFDNDWVEALIQLPTDEFFNTNIFTYLWVFNKNKPAERKNKVILINASDKFQLLKKNKGKKRKELTEQDQKEVVEALNKFEDKDFAKLFDKDFFYFNKQALMLTNLDENGKSLETYLGDKKSLKLDPIKITKDDEMIFDSFEITEYEGEYADLQSYNKEFLQVKINELDYKEQNIKIHTKDGIYSFNNDKETIIKESSEQKQELGCGKIIIKSSYKKATKTQSEKIVITVELTPDYQKDYEIVPYSRIESENQKNISDFMAKYITKPYELLDNTVGVEINFNKVFYKPEKLKPLDEIVSEIKTLDNDLKLLESNLGL